MSQNPHTPPASVQTALQLFRQGRAPEGLQMLRALADHGDRAAMEILGKIALQANRAAEAQRWLSAALEGEETVERLSALALAYLAGKSLGPAKICLKKAIALAPQEALPRCNLGRVLVSEGKNAEALPVLRQAVACDANYAPAQLYYGLALLGSGDAAGARPVLERARALEPRNPQAACGLAAALRDLKDFPAAIRNCREALKLQPKYAVAQDLLGNLYLATGQYPLALAAFERFLTLSPGSAEAHNACGMALSRMCRYADAIGHFRQAMVDKNVRPRAVIHLGQALLFSGQGEESLRILRQAHAEMPEQTWLLSALADTEQSLGLREEAYRDFLKLTEMSPDEPAAYRRLLPLCPGGKLPPSQEAHLKALEAKQDQLSTLAQAELHFALYRVCEGEEDYPAAMQHLLAANAARRSLLHYAPEAENRLKAKIQSDTPRELFVKTAGTGNPSEVPVFIVGMPRSGTSLLEQILAAHPDVFGAGEIMDFGEVIGCRAGALPDIRISSMSEEERKILAGRYLQKLRARAPDAKRIVNKLPWNYRFIGYIRLLFPRARILHTRRDAMDTCFSCFAQDFQSGVDFCYDQKELGQYYRGYEAMMAHWHDVLPEGGFLDVSYERLVTNFEPEVRRVLDFCGLDWNPACLNFYQSGRAVLTASAAQVRRPIYHSALGRWKKYRAGLGPLEKVLAGE